MPLFPAFKCNEQGYAEKDPENIATKIWAVESDWKSLITGERNGKQIIT